MVTFGSIGCSCTALPSLRGRGGFSLVAQKGGMNVKRLAFRPANAAGLRNGKSADGEELLLLDLILDCDDVPTFLARAAGLAAAHYSRLGMKIECGIVLGVNGKPMITAASGANAALLVDEQCAKGVGPCPMRTATADPVLIQNIRQTHEWPEFSSAASKLNIKSVLAVPLNVGTDAHAVLAAYSHRSGSFSAAGVESGIQFAGLISRVLRVVLLVMELREQRNSLLARNSLIDAVAPIDGSTANRPPAAEPS